MQALEKGSDCFFQFCATLLACVVNSYDRNCPFYTSGFGVASQVSSWEKAEVAWAFCLLMVIGQGIA